MKMPKIRKPKIGGVKAAKSPIGNLGKYAYKPKAPKGLKSVVKSITKGY
jgi:hypothetical protein